MCDLHSIQKDPTRQWPSKSGEDLCENLLPISGDSGNSEDFTFTN